MSDVSIKYKGVEKATLNASGTKTIKTSGKYCEDDIVVEYIDPQKEEQSKTLTLGASAPSIVNPDSGKVLSSVPVSIDSSIIKAENIAKDIVMLGITGTHEGGSSFSFNSAALPSKKYWCSICYGNGKFITVARGAGSYSTDGINWTSLSISPDSKGFVCYGNNKYVIVTDSGYSAYSTDGINWTAFTRITTKSFTSICYGNGMFIASCENSTWGGITDIYAYSTDGINWTIGQLPSSRTWYHTCYGNGMYIIGAEASRIYAYSTDCLNWTEVNCAYYFHSMCYGGGIFVGGSETGTLVYSTDGINWQLSPSVLPSKVFNVFAYGNGKFVVFGIASGCLYSTDGINWISVPSGEQHDYIYSTCYGKGMFVAVDYGEGDNPSTVKYCNVNTPIS